jgi:16S rRNA (uracil1498-N3)-methyltransferase
MKIHRFFIADDIVGATYVIQDEDLVHQITRVLRIGTGERIALVVGGGKQFLAEVVETEKRFVTVQVLEEQQVWVPKQRIIVCLSAIRKERFEWALEKCTEVGVSAVVPLIAARSERGVVQHERAQRIMQEAAEQCGRGDMPELGTPVTLGDMLPEVGDACVIACDMGGGHFSDVPHIDTADVIYLCIGPEGGWNDDERVLLQSHNAAFVSLGPTVLRAETAAVAACVLVQHVVE